MDNKNFIFSEKGNIIITNVVNSTINITQYLSRSIDYQELLRDLRELEDDLIEAKTLERRKSKEEKITKHKRLIKAFENDVFQLANTLLSSSNKSLRLKEALVYFEKGLFREAQTLLKVEDLIYDQDALLQKKEYSVKQLKELSESLENNAKEFFVKATLLQMEISSIRTVKYEPIGFTKFGEIPLDCDIIENVENNEESKSKQVNLAKEIDDLYQLSFKSCKRPRIIIKYLDFISILSLLEIPYISSYNFSKEKLLSEALDILKTEIRNNPEENGEDYLTVIEELNDIYFEKEEYNKIIVWCDKALNFIIKYDKFKDHIKSFELAKLSTLYNIAVKKEDINSALNVAREIVKLNPNDFKHDDSVTEFMLKLDHFTMRGNVISIYLEKEDFENARKEFFSAIDFGIKNLDLRSYFISLIIDFYEVIEENNKTGRELLNELIKHFKEFIGCNIDSIADLVEISIQLNAFDEENDEDNQEPVLQYYNSLIEFIALSDCEFSENLYVNYLELYFLKSLIIWSKIENSESLNDKTNSLTNSSKNDLINELIDSFSELFQICDEFIAKYPKLEHMEIKAQYMIHWVRMSQQIMEIEFCTSLHKQIHDILMDIWEKSGGNYLFKERTDEISKENLVEDFPINLIIADFSALTAVFHEDNNKDYEIALEYYLYADLFYELIAESLNDDITYTYFLCRFAGFTYGLNNHERLRKLIVKIEKNVKNKMGIPSWKRFCDAYETISKWQ